MAKDAPNHTTENMIGSAQTSRKILKDGDFPILPVILIIPNPCGLVFKPRTAPDWDHVINLLGGG